jgi:hypothetical protein
MHVRLINQAARPARPVVNVVARCVRKERHGRDPYYAGGDPSAFMHGRTWHASCCRARGWPSLSGERRCWHREVHAHGRVTCTAGATPRPPRRRPAWAARWPLALQSRRGVDQRARGARRPRTASTVDSPRAPMTSAAPRPPAGLTYFALSGGIHRYDACLLHARMSNLSCMRTPAFGIRARDCVNASTVL